VIAFNFQTSFHDQRTFAMAAQEGSVLLTGANGGLGSAIVSKILSTPKLASLYGIYAVRKVETASQLNRALQGSDTPPVHKHDVVPLDLSSLASVRALAADINLRVANRSIPPIRAIILNAAYIEWTEQTTTNDGFDMSFQSNYLGHWLLVLLLLQSMDRDEGRILVVGSSMHEWVLVLALHLISSDVDTCSANDPRNNNAGPVYVGDYKTIFHDTESLAKGAWSSALHDKSPEAGFRRYGAAKLCSVMNM